MTDLHELYQSTMKPQHDLDAPRRNLMAEQRRLSCGCRLGNSGDVPAQPAQNTNPETD